MDLLYYCYWFVSFMIAGDTLAWTNDEEFCRKVLGGLGLSRRVIEGVHFKTFETCNSFSESCFYLRHVKLPASLQHHKLIYLSKSYKCDQDCE